MRPVVLILIACALASCRTTQSPSALNANAPPFSVAEAAFIKKQGQTKISGHAFWRDGEGGTVNASGEIVRLVPATGYARERFAQLYKGRRSIDAAAIATADSDPAYADYTRTTRAEASGRFEFDGVAPGTYFVASQIVWKDKHQYVHFRYGAYNNTQRIGQDGGAMYETVTVTGKESGPLKLVLTNDR